MTFEQTLNLLKSAGQPEINCNKEKKFGIISNNALGIYQKELNEIAKLTGKDSELAIKLFDSGIYEARLLCGKIFRAEDLTEELMENWVKTFENWEICDTFCMCLFAKSRFAVNKAIEWSERKNEFEKRAGFAIMAAYSMADKKASNVVYENFLPIIIREAIDDRLYVKKAVNWALRSIGKRNADLNKKAITTAIRISRLDHKSARWIASDALKELEKKDVRISDYPREIYRK